jgi:hypothetical protein
MHVREPRICTLTWDDGDLAGLTVRLRALHVGHILAAGELANLDLADLGTGRISPENLERVKAATAAVAEALIGWDLYERDPRTGVVAPVPATAAGVRGQGIEFVMTVASNWMTVLSGRDARPELVADDEDDDLHEDAAPELPDELVAALPMEIAS